MANTYVDVHEALPTPTRGPWTAALVAVVVLSGCSDAAQAPVADDQLVSIEADAVMYGMEDYLTENGVRSGLILADTAYVYNDSSVVHMWGVDMTLFHENGSRRARVTSERGVLHQRTERMTARGDVVLVLTDSNDRIESAELNYDPNAQRIWSDSATVRHLPDGRETRGTCFSSDLDLENIDICDIRGAAEVGPTGSGDGGGGGGS